MGKIKTKNFRLPLFWKFSIAIILIVVVFGLINTILIYRNIQTSLQKETEKQGLFVAKSISDQITSLLLFEDYISLQNIINNMKGIDTTIAYIFILDNYNNLIVHTFENSLSSNLITANSLNNTQSSHSQLLRIEDKNYELILDIAYPIIGGKLGTVRVGIKQNSIQKNVDKTVKIFWLMVAFFLIVGIFGAFIFSYFITLPIRTIQNVADKLDFNSLEKLDAHEISIRTKILGKIPMLFRAKDEIDLLTEKFNDMIKRLSNAYMELKNAESQLIESEKLATIGIISAGVSHEINNPLSGIQNAIQRILDNPNNIKQNKKYLLLINQAIGRIEHVVKGLLSFARKEDFSFQLISPTDLLDEVMVLIKPKLESNNITLEKNINKNVDKIYCSPNHLEQVLLNLIINSIDAINEKENDSGKIKIIFKNERELTNLIIIDNGIGIKPENLNNIFEPFYTTKLKGRGTGLGLAVINNIISAHSGKIIVESEYGKWTKINIYLPRRKND